MADRLDELEGTYPGLEAFLATLERFFPAGQGLRELLIASLEAMGPAELAQGYRQLEEAGVMPHLDVRTDEQVGALWTNPLFEAVLDSIGFFPPPGIDLPRELPAPCRDWEDLTERNEQFAAMFPREPYWRCVLHRTFTELYLEPYLGKMAGPLRGCDIACGWGRASFCLRNFQEREVYGCDVSVRSLELLESLARSSGLSDRIRPVRSSLAQLPFEDDFFDFFVMFNILEQMTDPAIDRLLSEILRCARPGAVMYAEIAIHSVHPGLTHIQDFSVQGVVARLQSHRAHGKQFRMTCHRFVPEQFTFKIVKPAPGNSRFRRRCEPS